MISVKRVCLALGLVCLGAAASVDDESCLVQSQRDVVTKRAAALKPDLPSALAALQRVDLSALKQLAKQFPMPKGMGLPDGVAGGMGDMGNFSMTDMMNYAMEFMQLLKDQRVVDFMFESIKNMSTGLLGTSAVMLAGAKKLDAALDNSTEDAQVLEALKSFFATLSAEAANSAANATVDGRAFWALVPSDNSVKKMMEPVLRMTKNATKKDLSALVLSYMQQGLDELVRDGPTFCTKFGPVQGNLTAAKKYLQEEGPTAVESMRAMLPQVTPMLEGLAPEVAPTAMKLANATLDAVDEVIASAMTSVPAAVDAVMKAAKDKLHCTVTMSGAPLLRGRFGLAAALAAAAWMMAA